MPEKETAEIKLSPWEIEVGNSYCSYLLAQQKMENELEFSGKNHPIYHEIDAQIREIFHQTFHDPRVQQFIPEIFKLPERDIRTSLNGRYVIESDYPGLFPPLGGKEFDKYKRYFVPRTNEVLLINTDKVPHKSPFRLDLDMRYVPNVYIESNNEFIGVEAIRNSDTPEYVSLVKVGEGEDYGPLTINEIRMLSLDLDQDAFSANEKNPLMVNDETLEMTQLAWKQIDSLWEDRRNQKETVRQNNGKNLKNRVSSLNEALSRKLRFRNNYYRININFGSGDWERTQIDIEDNISYQDAKKWRDHRFWYSAGEDKLLISPYKSEPYRGLARLLVKLAYRNQDMLPNKVTIAPGSGLEAPDRYWCKAGPVIAEDLMSVLPESSLEKIRAVYGKIASSPIQIP